MIDINEIRNSFEQEMVDKGYKTFKSGFNSSLRGFQKLFNDDKGKRYFITIWHYNHAEQLDRDDVPKKDSYTADSQFTFKNQDKDATCNVEFWGDVTPNEYRPLTTLKDIEDFFEKFWYLMKPDYYESYS
jgi:hypothetical protein